MTTSGEILNDLIEINNDRIKGYRHALDDLQASDADLKTLFAGMIDQTKRFNEELAAHVAGGGDEVNNTNTVLGSLHRAWIDVKATFSGNDRKSILEECERGEDASKKAYNDALSDLHKLTPQEKDLVSRQAAAMQENHDKIKSLRNAEQ